MQPNIVMCSRVLQLGCRVETVAAGMLCEHKFRHGFVVLSAQLCSKPVLRRIFFMFGPLPPECDVKNEIQTRCERCQRP